MQVHLTPGIFRAVIKSSSCSRWSTSHLFKFTAEVGTAGNQVAGGNRGNLGAGEHPERGEVVVRNSERQAGAGSLGRAEVGNRAEWGSQGTVVAGGNRGVEGTPVVGKGHRRTGWQLAGLQHRGWEHRHMGWRGRQRMDWVAVQVVQDSCKREKKTPLK